MPENSSSLSLQRYWYLLRTQWRTPPNIITFLRLAGTVLVVMFIVQHHLVAAAILFVLLAATDWVDGWLAKRNGGRWVTEFGKITDPIVDKILVLSTLVAIAAIRADWFVLGVVATTILREIAVAAAKMAKAKTVKQISSAGEAGRFSMVAQSIAGAVLLLAIAGYVSITAAHYLLVFSLGASLASGWAYVADSRKRP